MWGFGERRSECRVSAREVLNVGFRFYRDNFTVSMPVAEEPEDRISTLLESEGFRRI